MEPTSQISLCDLLAYKIGRGVLPLVYGSLQREGKATEMPTPGFKRNQLGQLVDSFFSGAPALLAGATPRPACCADRSVPALQSKPATRMHR